MTDVQPAAGPARDTDRESASSLRPGTPATRRGLLAGAGAVGVGALLAACGTDSGTATGTGTGTGGQPIPAGSADPGSGGGSNGGSNGGSSGAAALAAAADVPVGGGLITDRLVVTQPTEGEFKAFSKICTHAQCPVTQIAGGTINCRCHGSKFSITDGSVQGGPAQAPLAETKVRKDGDNIVEA